MTMKRQMINKQQQFEISTYLHHNAKKCEGKSLLEIRDLLNNEAMTDGNAIGAQPKALVPYLKAADIRYHRMRRKPHAHKGVAAKVIAQHKQSIKHESLIQNEIEFQRNNSIQELGAAFIALGEKLLQQQREEQ